MIEGRMGSCKCSLAKAFLKSYHFLSQFSLNLESFFVKYFFRKKKFRNKNIYFFLLFFVSFRPGCFSVSSGLLRAFAFSELSFRFRTYSKLEPTDPSGRKIFRKPKWVIFAGHPVTLSVFLIYYSSVQANPAALRIEKTI